MKITKLWHTDEVHKLVDKTIKLNQASKVREQIASIHRRLTRIDVALSTLDGIPVAEANKQVAKMFKLLHAAKNAESLLMIRVNMERFKDTV